MPFFRIAPRFHAFVPRVPCRANTLLAHLLILILIAHGHLGLAGTIYDNTSVAFPPDVLIGIDSSATRFAQPFLLGSNTAVTAVTIPLARIGQGPQGSVRIELWTDDGSGNPEAMVAELGKLPDDEIDSICEFGSGCFRGTPLTFQPAVSGLSPGRLYHVVLSLRDATVSPSNTLRWGLNTEPDGTFSAPPALVNQGATDSGWERVGGSIEKANYFRMRVEASPVPEPSTAALALTLLLCTNAIRKKTQELHSAQLCAPT